MSGATHALRHELGNLPAKPLEARPHAGEIAPFLQEICRPRRFLTDRGWLEVVMGSEHAEQCLEQCTLARQYH